MTTNPTTELIARSNALGAIPVTPSTPAATPRPRAATTVGLSNLLAEASDVTPLRAVVDIDAPEFLPDLAAMRALIANTHSVRRFEPSDRSGDWDAADARIGASLGVA